MTIGMRHQFIGFFACSIANWMIHIIRNRKRHGLIRPINRLMTHKQDAVLGYVDTLQNIHKPNNITVNICMDCQLSNAHLLVRQGGSLAQIAQWQKVTLDYRGRPH